MTGNKTEGYLEWLRSLDEQGLVNSFNGVIAGHVVASHIEFIIKLLKEAICPYCHGSGFIGVEYPNREVVREKCDWCPKRDMVVSDE